MRNLSLCRTASRAKDDKRICRSSQKKHECTGRSLRNGGMHQHRSGFLHRHRIHKPTEPSQRIGRPSVTASTLFHLYARPPADRHGRLWENRRHETEDILKPCAIYSDRGQPVRPPRPRAHFGRTASRRLRNLTGSRTTGPIRSAATLLRPYYKQAMGLAPASKWLNLDRAVDRFLDEISIWVVT